MRAPLVLVCIFFVVAAQAQTVGDVIRKGEPLPATTEVTGSIDKARAAYASFLAGGSDSPHRATALRRLADLELEAGLRQLEAGAEASFAKPITLYREFLETYPDDAARDHVLYQLARALDNSGKTGAALSYLEQLTEAFFDSPLAAEALFRQGEMLFIKRRYADAARAYAAVYNEHSGTRFETNARYKHGWSLFKTDRFAAAVARFAGLVDYVLDDAAPVPAQIEAFTPGQREMFEDALRASSIALVELGGATELEFLINGEPLPAWAYLFYERLGEHYLGEERFAEAAASFGAYAQRVPTDAQAPILQARVIETYEAAGFAERVIGARGDFVRAYGFDAPFWQGREPADHPQIATQLDHHLKALTEHYHAAAQAGDVTAVEPAVQWYRAWLKFFPEVAETPARNFLLAELLFDSRRFAEAAMEYERTAYDYPAHERASEAGYAALLARDSAYQAGAGEEVAVLRQLALDSRLRFADTWPQNPRTPPVLLDAAEELFALEQREDAIAVAARTLEYAETLSPQQQRTAWVVQAHARFDMQQHALAETAYRAALEVSDPADALTGELQERLAASVYEQGRVARDDGDLATAAGHFSRIGGLAFASSVHPVALYDAAAALINLERWDDAAQSLQAFRLRYPSHRLAAGIAEQLTGVYLQGNRPLDAAAELTGIAGSTDAATATAARWQAAELYHDNDASEAHLEVLQSLAASPQTPVDDAMRAREQLLTMFLEKNDSSSVRYWREQIVAADAAAGAARSDYSRTMAARAALALAEPLADYYATLNLTLPLQGSLPVKKKALEQARAAFERIADYGIDDTSSAATFHIAELYRGFGKALMDSQRPQLDELALEEYEFLLEEQAFPFEEKAIELHQINTARAAKLVYNEWVARSFTRLAELMPARYNRMEQRESLVSQID
ncbi:MAG: tetratricopeptide repeat protein [Gammaproteobacteria bacterium]|nr:tetratricopeptide repeat protein [Gammaproteobacteria bacterium]